MNNSKTGRIIVTSAIALYMLLLGLISHLKFSNYMFSDFDLAIHSQSTWNILHGSIESSILGIPFPGNHMALILFLIAPLYAIFSSPLLLLHIQTAMLAMGAMGIYMLAKKELSEKWATGLAISYLLYPPLIYMNLYEFHPVALATCFLIFMLYFYRAGHFRMFLLFLTLALLCQENISLIVAAFAVYAFVEGRRGLWVWIPLAFGTGYFILTVLFIMPRLNNNTIQFWQLYAHLGDSPAQIARNIIFHPLQTLSLITNHDKVTFINALFGPLGYLSILNPVTLIPAIPIFCQRLLSDRLSETRIIFHYQAELIPFIFVSAIYGIKRFLACKYQLLHSIPVILLLVFSSSALLFSGVVGKTYKAFTAQETLRETGNMALSHIPPNAPVAATFEFLPKLSNRTKLYSLHHIYTGKYTMSYANYPTPDDIRYIIINTADQLAFSNNGFYGPDRYKNLQALTAKGTWEVIENMDSILVLERTANTPDHPPELINIVSPETPMNTNVVQSNTDTIKMQGFSIIGQEDNNVIALTLYWKKTRPDTREYDVALTLTDDNTLYRGAFPPGHRIWPTQSWPVSTGTNKTLVKDTHFIRLNYPITMPGKLQIQAKLVPVN